MPIISDVRDIRKETIPSEAIPGRTTRAILLTGGPPCQPFSDAGKRQGKLDDRYLWPEMFRVISEIRPDWVVIENVTGIVRMALDTVWSDLESEDYEVGAFNIPACGVGAPHIRQRIWIVANSLCNRSWSEAGDFDHERGSASNKRRTGLQDQAGRDPKTPGCDLKSPGSDGGQDVADPQGSTNRKLLLTRVAANSPSKSERGGERGFLQKKGSFERSLGQLAHGLPSGLDRDWWTREPGIPRLITRGRNTTKQLKALGNAIVPQVAYQIMKGIADINGEVGESVKTAGL